MPPKKTPIPQPKGGPRPPRGAEMDEKAKLAFGEQAGGGYAALAHSSTPEKRDMRQLLREAHKKGVKPEVLAAIGRAGGAASSSASPSPAAKKGGGEGA